MEIVTFPTRWASYLALYTFVAFLGFVSADVKKTNSNERSPSSWFRSVNSFSQLPCPSEEKYLELARTVKLSIPDGQEGKCDDSLRAKMGKILLLGESLGARLPDSWDQVIQKPAIDEPWSFVGKNVLAMGVDLTQTTSLASNLGRIVMIGGGFFEQDPLLAVAILVHEAQHSSRDDPGHVDCLFGDIPKSRGGCDKAFSISSGAGGYSFDLVYMLGLGLYGRHLAKADREYLMSRAVTQLSNRFNEVPTQLGWPVERIAVLTQQKRVLILSPFGSYHRDITPLPEQVSGSIERIEYHPRENGIVALTSQHQLFQWSERGGWRPLDGELLAGLEIKAYGKVFFSGERGATYRFYLTTDGKLFYRDIDPQTGKFILTPTREQPIDLGLRFEDFVLADGRAALFLEESGSIRRFIRNARGGAVSFIPFGDFVAPKGSRWQRLYGGVTYDSLFGITQDGQLLRMIIEDGRYATVPVREWSAHFLLDYEEGVTAKFGLDKEGNILQLDWNGEAPLLAVRGNFRDFAILRHYYAQDILRKPEQKSIFGVSCGLRQYIREPWEGFRIGINRRQKLIWSRSGKCQEVAEKVTKVELAADESGSFARVKPVLKITLIDGSVKFLRPYLSH